MGEKAGVAQIIQDYDSTSDVIGLSRKVADFYKADLQEGYEIISAAITGQTSDPRAVEMATKYQNEILSLTAKMTQASVFGELAKAFVLILYRVEGAEGITMESVSELHPDLLAGLASLYDDEEAKTVEKLTESGGSRKIEEIEEAGKK